MNIVRSKDGTSIAFDRSGIGPALILVGGAMSDRTGAATVSSLLASRFTVFAYDRRGRGDSGDTPPYAVEREVEDLDALIGEAGGSAFVMGGSSGAVLALDAAARGLAITELVLYEPPLIVDSGRLPLPAGLAAHLAELVSDGRRGDAVAAFMSEALSMPPEVIAQMRSAPFWAGLEKIAHTLPYDLIITGPIQTGSPALLDRWSSITAPALVMDGGESPAWMHTGVRALAEILPNATHWTLEGQTHAADPKVLAAAMEDFLARARVGS
jgi:pimeloyl-ACP methyl ester carboxylesterase